MPTVVEMKEFKIRNEESDTSIKRKKLERSDSFSSQFSRKRAKVSIAEQIRGKKSYQCLGLSISTYSIKVIQMTMMFISLILLGGLIFSLLEAPREEADLALAKAAHAKHIDNVMVLLNGNQTLFEALRAANGAEAFKSAPAFEGNWDFDSACMFAFTVVTTIGKLNTFAQSKVIELLIG